MLGSKLVDGREGGLRDGGGTGEGNGRRILGPLLLRQLALLLLLLLLLKLCL